ncbi:hypothetical protein Tco_1147852 [Tanacetum coccineum]
MLLMALPNEHLLTFNQYKDAKTLFAAIHARFGGNDATKKTQKTLLKQMYENFKAPSTESLDSIFNWLHKIVSQLAILGENISQEDLNLKFLRSLPSEWNTHVVVWRNKPDLDTMSFDNLYNNFKIVEQEVKKTVTTTNLSDATVYAFLANQPNGSHLVHKDLEQIHKDDLEEMDLKWQLALLSMRARKYFQRTGKKITINGSDTVGYDKSKSFLTYKEVPTNMALMAFSDSEFEGYGVKGNKSVCENSSNEIKKTFDALIIKEWVSDSDEDESEVMVVKSDNVQYKPKQENQPRKVSQNRRNNRIKWNEMKTQKLGVGFQFTKKACFVCGSFNHLIKDCDFHDKKMVQKPVLNNVQKGTGEKDVRPVWNNAMRTNHQNFSKTRRNFAPTAVLTKSGIVPISAARQSSSRAAAPVSTARPINTAAPKPFENVAKPRPNVNSVNTAKEKRVTSAVGEQRDNAVKYMTGNKSYLIDYQDYDGGFVTFADSSKGGKITGKDKIRTGKLDFADMYFVKELKFNLFSVSQMCDRKNSVLFTETKCLILSPEFKLLDES